MKGQRRGLPWWLNGKESAVSAKDTGSIAGPGGSHMLNRN